MQLSNLLIIDKSTHIISTSIWFLSLVCILLFSALTAIILRHRKNIEDRQLLTQQFGLFVIQVAKKPFLTLFFSYVLYEMLMISIVAAPQFFQNKLEIIISASSYVLKMIEFSTFFWFVLNVLNAGQKIFYRWSVNNNKSTLRILLPMIGSSIKAVVILIMLNMIIPEIGITGFALEALQKLAKVMLIGILAFLFIQLLNGIEKLILTKYNASLSFDAETRKINTQVKILKKVFLSLIMVVATAAILMVFDSVKHLGAGILTTAGIVSALGAFASQQTLSRIFSGLQIAFTQPISIGDTVIIDKESGQIEEITLSHITVKMWDLRRIILPTDYFTNKGLQSLSRSTPELIGTIYFYTDFTAPVDSLRKQFQVLLNASKFWNQQTGSFDVTDLKETCMELRGLVSAEDAAALGKLSCEIREKMMRYIVDYYPDCLPRTRSIAIAINQKSNKHSNSSV